MCIDDLFFSLFFLKLFRTWDLSLNLMINLLKSALLMTIDGYLR